MENWGDDAHAWGLWLLVEDPMFLALKWETGETVSGENEKGTWCNQTPTQQPVRFHDDRSFRPHLAAAHLKVILKVGHEALMKSVDQRVVILPRPFVAPVVVVK